MAEIATSEFLERMKRLYPRPSSDSTVSAYVEDPWFIVTAVSFAASNRPDGVPRVLDHVLRTLTQLRGGETSEEFEGARNRVVLKLREALLKGGLICGYSRVSGLPSAVCELSDAQVRRW